MNTTTRRAILGAAVAAGAMTGAAAGVAITTAVTAAAEPDPIFGLIERHRAAYEAHGKAIEAGDDDWVADQRIAAACDADCDALRTLVSTVPSTAAGAAAMIRYIIELGDGNEPLRTYMSDDQGDHRLTGDALLSTLVTFMEARA